MKQRTPATEGQTPPLLWGLLCSLSAPETPGCGTAVPGQVGRVRLKLFCFFSLEQIWEPRLVGGVFLCGASPSTPGPQPPAECVCPMEKNPTTTPHLFSPRSNPPRLPALQTSPLQANVTLRGHSVAPAPRTLPPSHRLFWSCAFPRSFRGDRRDAPRLGRSDPGAAGEDARERPNVGERG